LEQKLTRLKDLIAKRDEIDAELGQMLGIEKKERKPQACSKCGSTEHTARNCESKLPAVAI
jgi:hypothetical protein